MQSYYTEDIWDKNTLKMVPYTCKKASPNITEGVVNLTVIEVINANYRNATFSGIFVISPFEKLPIKTVGTGKIDVLCRWFEHRLKSTGLSLRVNFSNVKFLKNYTGLVVSNIGKP